ncbi:MAG: Crp/Fnr family transcriptional regulator [Hyphomicrobiaceae bacterium]
MLATSSGLVSLPAGSHVYGPGQAPHAYLLLLAGTVRVQQVSEGGREIVLYRVQTGESCALTTACLMSYEDYPAEAIAESDVVAAAIPRATFDELVARSDVFRRFVFQAFSTRLTDLFRIIEEVAFARLDIRLAQKLVERAHGSDEVEATHGQLAAELGSAREVVSRTLGEFQRRGWITSGRGHITIRDTAALKAFAAH